MSVCLRLAFALFVCKYVCLDIYLFIFLCSLVFISVCIYLQFLSRFVSLSRPLAIFIYFYLSVYIYTNLSLCKYIHTYTNTQHIRTYAITTGISNVGAKKHDTSLPPWRRGRASHSMLNQHRVTRRAAEAQYPSHYSRGLVYPSLFPFQSARREEGKNEGQSGGLGERGEGCGEGMEGRGRRKGREERG